MTLMNNKIYTGDLAIRMIISIAGLAFEVLNPVKTGETIMTIR